MEEIVEMEIIIMEIIMVDIQITMAAIQTMEDIPITMVDTPTTMVDIPTTTVDIQQDQHIDQTIMEAILVTEMEDIQIIIIIMGTQTTMEAILTIMVGIQVMVIADILAMVMEATQTMDTLETVSGLQEVIKSKMSLLRSEHDIVMIILMLINEMYKS